MKKILVMGLVAIMIMSLTACGGKNTKEDNSDNSTAATSDSICPASKHGNHNWMRATCQEPSKCEECDAYKNDELGDHYWDDATCKRPAKCIYCGIYIDDKLGTHEFLSDGECLHCGIKYEDYVNLKE